MTLILVQLFSNTRVGMFVIEGKGKGSRWGCVVGAEDPTDLTTAEFDSITQGIPLRAFEYDLEEEFEFTVTITDNESLYHLECALGSSGGDMMKIRGAINKHFNDTK